MSYTTHISNSIGGVFVSADGSRRVIPNHLLTQAKLEDETLLRLHYSYGTVEIVGRRLNTVFRDAATGRLGTVTIDAEDAVRSTTAPIITSIVYIPESSLAASARERSDVRVDRAASVW